MLKTLKGKISFIYLCLVILIGIVGAMSFFNLFRLSQSIDGLMTQNYKSINAVTNTMEAIERQDSAVLIYMNIDRQKGIDLFSENNASFLQWYSVEQGNITEQGEQEIVDNIKTYYMEYTKLFSNLQEIRNSQDEAASVAFYDKVMMPDFLRLKQELKSLITLNEKAMFLGRDRATQNASQSTAFILGLTALAIVGGFLLSRYFANRFLKPIYALNDAIHEIKAGNMNKQAEVVGQDEIAVLTREFNQMTQRLQVYEQSAMGTLLSEKNKSLAIVKSISDPLIVMDTNFRVVLLNDASEHFFNVKEEKAVNRHFLESIRNGELFDFISSAVDAREESVHQIIHLQSEGEDFFFKVVITAIKSGDDGLGGMAVLLQNVTQLKQLEQIRTDFIATISHEFKTPLTSIMMGSNLLMKEGMGLMNEEQRSILQAIQEDGERLAALVNDLLELSKIESGKAIYHFEACSVDGIIHTSIKQFLQQASQREIVLQEECEDDLPRVRADYEKVTWVLNNLISNALNHTNSGDMITVSASVLDGKMQVSVKDTGVGIPGEYVDRIFDKFVQVRDEDFEVRGTGLGLAVVKQIIEAHDGQIRCESKLDAGSNFIFTLNLA